MQMTARQFLSERARLLALSECEFQVEAKAARARATESSRVSDRDSLILFLARTGARLTKQTGRPRSTDQTVSLTSSTLAPAAVAAASIHAERAPCMTSANLLSRIRSSVAELTGIGVRRPSTC
jgi:hypothetical protein